MRNQKALKITGEANLKIKKLSEKAFPFEACGIVLGRRADSLIEDVADVLNSTDKEERKKYFEIDPMEMLKVERLTEEKGAEILGIFHSHPDKPAILSKEDEKYMIPGLIYIIAAAYKDGISDIRGYLRDTPSEAAYEVFIEEE